VLQKQLDRLHVLLADGEVERRVVVEATLLNIGAMGEQQLQDLVHVPALTARERGDQRRKAGVVAVVGIGPERQQAADEGERAVIDGVFEDDLADPVGAAAVPRT
jgi:hypothetical protein